MGSWEVSLVHGKVSVGSLGETWKTAENEKFCKYSVTLQRGRIDCYSIIMIPTPGNVVFPSGLDSNVGEKYVICG